MESSIKQMFYHRREEVVAEEKVTEIGIEVKSTKQQRIVLARPITNLWSNSRINSNNTYKSCDIDSISNFKKGTIPHAISKFDQERRHPTINLVSLNKEKNTIKMKRVYDLLRLVEITHQGSFDASFDFAVSGMLNVSFESYVQREMFVAAVNQERCMWREHGDDDDNSANHNNIKKNNSSSNYPECMPTEKWSTNGVNTVIRGVLTDAVGKEIEAVAASRVRQLRLQKRRVYTRAEETKLLHAISSIGLDDTNQLNSTFLRKQKSAELVELDKLIRLGSEWEAIQHEVQKLVTRVEDVERRVESYSQHLISKKDVIKQIERDNSNEQNKQLNLEQLEQVICNLQSQLNLDPELLSVVHELRNTEDDGLITFFDNSDKATRLSNAVSHMETVIHNTELDHEYPIAAVEERKTYFKELRNTIAHKTQNYLLLVINEYESLYLSQRERFSREGTLVWRNHAELHSKLIPLGKVIKVMLEILPESFLTVLRKYRVTSQKVYALEIHRFFKSLRRELKKVHITEEPFLIGSEHSLTYSYCVNDAFNWSEACCEKITFTENNENDLIACDNHVENRNRSSITINTNNNNNNNNNNSVHSYNSVNSAEPKQSEDKWKNQLQEKSASLPSSALPTSPPFCTPEKFFDFTHNVNSYTSTKKSPNGGLSECGMFCTQSVCANNNEMQNECVMKCVHVELPESVLKGKVSFYQNSNVLLSLNIPQASVSFAASLQALSPSNVFGGDKRINFRSSRNAEGNLRPDLAVAMMLEAVLNIIHQEEFLLIEVFGLSEAMYYSSTIANTSFAQKCNADARYSTTEVQVGETECTELKNCNTFTSKSIGEECTNNHEVVDDSTVSKSGVQDNSLMMESLAEIFGGDKVTAALVKQIQGCPLHDITDAHHAIQPLSQQSELSSLSETITPRYREYVMNTSKEYNAAQCDNLCFDWANSRTNPATGELYCSTANNIDCHANTWSMVKQEFCFLAREVIEFISFVTEKCDRIFTLPIMCMVKACKTNNSWKCVRSPFCQLLLREVEAIVAQSLMRFVAEQTASILRCRNKYFIKPTALLNCFGNLPCFLLLQEKMFALFEPHVRDYSDYNSIANSFIKQIFTVLDVISDGRENVSGEREEGLKLNDIIKKRFSETFVLPGSEKGVFKRGVIRQYRHHSFFCAVCYLFPSSTYTSNILQEYYRASHERRRSSEEIYRTRILFLHHFPRFGPFVLAAEDLSSVYSSEDLKHHKSLSVENVSSVTTHLGEELRNGIRSSSCKMKRHLLHDVEPGSTQESFHRTLLQRTWLKYSEYILQKYSFMIRFMNTPQYSSLSLPYSYDEVQSILTCY